MAKIKRVEKVFEGFKVSQAMVDAGQVVKINAGGSTVGTAADAGDFVGVDTDTNLGVVIDKDEIGQGKEYQDV